MMTIPKVALPMALLACLLAGCATVGAHPGSELVRHSLRVEGPRGPATILAFAPGGSVTGTTNGNSATGRWEVVNKQICVTFERTGRECFPYAEPFKPGQTVTLTGTSGMSVRATLQ